MMLTYLPENDQTIIDGVLQWFAQICAVPHGSGNEKALSDVLKGRFTDLGWTVRQDAWHNLCVDIPGTAGLEAQQPVILQGHIDMVCAVAEGSGYVPERDPVAMVVDGDVLRSDGRSSLGADNGLTIAMAAYLMTTDLPHGPVRLLLTTCEEVGMYGAKHMSPDWLADCRCLINMDGAHMGTIIIGCAGGRTDVYTRELQQTGPTHAGAFEITVSGLRSGHSSGFDALFRGNAIKLLGFFLAQLQEKLAYELADFRGGQAQNAIPAEAKAVVVTDDADALLAAVDRFRAETVRFYRGIDPDVQVTLTETALPEQVWTAELTDSVLNLTNLLFHGVYGMHATINKLPSASCNLGILRTNDAGQIEAVSFTRCAAGFAEQRLGLQHSRTAGLCGFALQTDSHAGWDGTADSDLVRLADRVYTELFGSGMEICPIHAGLEPGILGAKNPDLTMIAIGPDIYDLHSVKERASLPSLVKFTRFIASLLEALARE